MFCIGFASVVEPHHVVRLGYHGVIDPPVQTGLLHAGEVVELQEPGLHCLVKEEVDPEQLVTVVITLRFLLKYLKENVKRSLQSLKGIVILPCNMSGRPHIIVFTQVFLIRLQTRCQSIPFFSKYFQNVLSDHL